MRWPTACRSLAHTPWGINPLPNPLCLEGAPALLVNVAETLTLLALLEQAGRGHDEDGVDADHAKHGGEDVVDEDVGERGDGRGAPAHEGSSRGAGAHGIGDEGGRGAVEVAAAGELMIC